MKLSLLHVGFVALVCCLLPWAACGQNCPMELIAYQTRDECVSNDIPTATATIYVDGVCRNVGSSSPSLPGNYRAYCRNGRVWFAQSGCTSDICSGLGFYNTCDNDDTLASHLYSRTGNDYPVSSSTLTACSSVWGLANLDTSINSTVAFTIRGECTAECAPAPTPPPPAGPTLPTAPVPTPPTPAPPTDCGMQLHIWDDPDQCGSNNPADLVTTIYPDGQCQATTTDSTTAAALLQWLPDVYNARCTSANAQGSVTFAKSGCTSVGECASSTVCNLDLDRPGTFYANIVDPPAYQVFSTSFLNTPGFTYSCFVLTATDSEGTTKRFGFALFGSCGNPGCAVVDAPTNMPTVPPTNMPLITAMPITDMPMDPPTDMPIPVDPPTMDPPVPTPTAGLVLPPWPFSAPAPVVTPQTVAPVPTPTIDPPVSPPIMVPPPPTPDGVHILPPYPFSAPVPTMTEPVMPPEPPVAPSPTSPPPGGAGVCSSVCATLFTETSCPACDNDACLAANTMCHEDSPCKQNAFCSCDYQPGICLAGLEFSVAAQCISSQANNCNAYATASACTQDPACAWTTTSMGMTHLLQTNQGASSAGGRKLSWRMVALVVAFVAAVCSV